jgi:heme a synthase
VAGAAKGRLLMWGMAPYDKGMNISSEINSPSVGVWLWAIAVLIFCMVIVGGATRLTDSGLSITEWKPLLGAIPPLNEAHWLEAFEKYKLIPEYQVQNRGMTLEDFKFIYWWEWAHRFLGRIIGFAFIVPLVFFMATRRIARSLWKPLVVLFLLGGLQGALGWYMVSSGLSERVDVSQYRLAAHLTLAFALFAAVVFTALRLNKKRQLQWGRASYAAAVFIGLLFLQVAAGGFVAGLDAGHASYTWPKMNDAFAPDGLSTLQPIWKNWFENALSVQFNHRLLAYGLWIYVAVQALWLRNLTSILVFIAVTAQALLGILTIVWQVPVTTALLHQGGALLVLIAALIHFIAISRVPVPDQR